MSEEMQDKGMVRLSDIKENQKTGLHENITTLLEEGHTITFKPGEPYRFEDEYCYPVEVQVWVGGQFVKAVGMILDEVVADVYSSTPEQAAGEEEW